MTTDLKVPVTIYLRVPVAEKFLEIAKSDHRNNRSEAGERLFLDAFEYRRSLPDPHPMGQ